MPADPIARTPWVLTGQRRHRRGFFGRMILQVEETCRVGPAHQHEERWSSTRSKWRDASWQDVLSLERRIAEQFSWDAGAPAPSQG